jgi:hypothetical protein
MTMESNPRKVIPHYFCAGAFFSSPDGELIQLNLPSATSKDFQKIQSKNLSQELKLPKNQQTQDLSSLAIFKPISNYTIAQNRYPDVIHAAQSLITLYQQPPGPLST